MQSREHHRLYIAHERFYGRHIGIKYSQHIAFNINDLRYSIELNDWSNVSNIFQFRSSLYWLCYLVIFILLMLFSGWCHEHFEINIHGIIIMVRFEPIAMFNVQCLVYLAIIISDSINLLCARSRVPCNSFIFAIVAVVSLRNPFEYFIQWSQKTIHWNVCYKGFNMTFGIGECWRKKNVIIKQCEQEQNECKVHRTNEQWTNSRFYYIRESITNE